MSRVATAPHAFRPSPDTPLLTRIETGGVSGEMLFQLHKHLADMDRLCRQAKVARAECRPYRDPTASLLDELIETIELHRDLIADQLSERVAPEGQP